MNGLIRKGLIVVATAVVLAMPAAADVYMWRDADGTVHYGDKPGTREAQRLDIETRRTDKAAVAARFEKRQSARAELTTNRAQEREDAEQQAADAAEERAARETRCEEARERLRNYVNSRRLYRLDEDGERQYLDAEEISEARMRAEQAVTEHCD